MPQKRTNLAASLRAQGPAKKAARMDEHQETGPLVACVRPWGSAAWVFQGLLTPAVFFRALFLAKQHLLRAVADAYYFLSCLLQ